MTKIYEEFFSEYQADMVSFCLEYVNEKADTVYIYCAMTRMTCACSPHTIPDARNANDVLKVPDGLT